MIRAKTLLACIVTTAAAVTAFALNSSHDAYVPHTHVSNEDSGTTMFKAQPRVETPSGAIAQLPKLAEPTTLTPTPDPFTPTVVELDPVAAEVVDTAKRFEVKFAKRSASIEAEPKTRAIDDRVLSEHSATSEPVDLKIADSAATLTKQVATMPLPSRLPTEYQLLREDRLLRATHAEANAADNLLFDPAVPGVRARKSSHKRRTGKRHRSPRKQYKPAAAVVEAKAKPVRHRQPFDSNRN